MNIIFCSVTIRLIILYNWNLYLSLIQFATFIPSMLHIVTYPLSPRYYTGRLELVCHFECKIKKKTIFRALFEFSLIHQNGWGVMKMWCSHGKIWAELIFLSVFKQQYLVNALCYPDVLINPVELVLSPFQENTLVSSTKQQWRYHHLNNKIGQMKWICIISMYKITEIKT